MSNIPVRSSFRVIALCGCLCVSIPAQAQEPAQPDSIPTVELQEVVVTASRGGGDLLRLPMAVGTISAQELTAGRRMGLSDALNSIPGILAQSRAGGSDVRLTIRGFGARGSGERSNAATIRGIKVLIDGIPETDPDGRTSLDLVDLAAVKRIEVIRTNASTLFGNASGGVINIETFARVSAPSASSDNTFGSFGLRRTSLAAESPIGSGSFSFSLSNSSFSGWRQNSESFATQIHSGILADLGTTTKLRFLVSAASNAFSIPGPLTLAEFRSSPSMANSTYLSRRERRANKIGRLAASLSTSLSSSEAIDVLLFAAPKELRRSERNTYREFYRLHSGFGVVYNHAPWDETFRRLTAGVDGAYQDGAILFYDLVNGERGTTLRTNKKEAAVTLGAFLEGEIGLTSSLSLVLGARFDRQLYVSRELPSTLSSGTGPEQLGLSHVTPKVSLLYAVGEHHSVYSTISGGIEAPAFNEVDPPPTLPNVALNPLLKPMTSTTVEVGAKGYFFPEGFLSLSAASYSLALYQISVHNEIVPYNGGAWYFSAGASRRYGFEAGAQVEFRGGFSAGVSLTLLQSKYLEYGNDVGTFSDNQAPGIPATVLNARFAYSAPYGIRVVLRGNHVGGYFADDANTLRVPSSTIWSALLSMTQELQTVQVTAVVGVNNLVDKSSVASAYINPASGTNPSFLEPVLPRNIFTNIDLRLSL